MGMTWRSTMPLLSTLAALVIIVHSAEEDAERSNRYEIRPRVMDTRPSNYEQAWRVVEPVIQHSATADIWNDDPQETPPVRRRPGRKRKRRPPADTSDDIAPRRRYANNDDDFINNYETTPQRRYAKRDDETSVNNDQTTPRRRYVNNDDKTTDNNYETTLEDTVEVPRRPRITRKYRLDRYTDNPNTEDVPLRRRMRRKKRPSLDTWPTLSEFGDFAKNDDNRYPAPKQDDYDEDGQRIDDDKDVDKDVDKDDGKDVDKDDGKDDGNDKRYAFEEEYVEKKEITLNTARSARPKYKFVRNKKLYEQTSSAPEDNKSLPKYKFARNKKLQEQTSSAPEDSKSLSEFSIEVMNINKDNNENLQDQRIPKSIEKTPAISHDVENTKDQLFVLELDKYFDFKSSYLSMSRKIKMKRRKINKSLTEIMQEVKSFIKSNGKIDFPLEKLRKIYVKRLKKAMHKLPKKHQPKRTFTDERIKRDHSVIEPQTLKDILKKSNGTSLSEILQQHNLSLADLLSGKQNALSVLRSQELLEKSDSKNATVTMENNNEISFKSKNNGKLKNLENVRSNDTKVTKINFDNKDADTNKKVLDTKTVNKENVVDERDKIIVKEEKYVNQNFKKDKFVNTDLSENQNIIQNVSINTNSTPTILANRRFSGAVRRKLRMRPMLSNNYKSQLNRDLIALSARRYIHHNRRNTTKAKEWKDMIPLMSNINATGEVNVTNDDIMLTTTIDFEETTTATNLEEMLPVTNIDTTIFDNDVEDTTVTEDTEEVETTTLMLEILEAELPSNFTERPKVTPITRTLNASGLRRQAYNNKLNKKRLQQKTSTTEPPPNDVMKNFLSMGDFVSSSEFIARTQLPRFTNPVDIRETVTELEDFMTTETTSQTNSGSKSKRLHTHRLSTKPSTVTDYPITTTTEETAKIEIQEILNDTQTSTKLSKILKERNMTLIELLEHRERGSSHVHLADIFHNASREPNPPEPFLTKSLIEPISKETYPLRALLDANSHDTTTRSTTVDPDVPLTNHISIPVTMAFGNNVNENAENMGIMSLFNNLTEDAEPAEKRILQKDSEGTPYKSTIINVNATDDENDTRESRMMNDDQDMVSWNEIFAMIRQTHKNESAELDNSKEGAPILTKQRKMTVETDADGDGLIVLEDLQHISESDTKTAPRSLEKVEYNSYESGEEPQNALNGLPSNVKSVTVTTASLVGLAMILFLLTYSALKWKQQGALNRKNNFNNEQIPTPVFENRKVKKNCSSRSISPMLPTSNIYTMNTLQSQNGKDSPEYMWDTLRKPFQ